jgi:hypothetical protein
MFVLFLSLSLSLSTYTINKSLIGSVVWFVMSILSLSIYLSLVMSSYSSEVLWQPSPRMWVGCFSSVG